MKTYMKLLVLLFLFALIIPVKSNCQTFEEYKKQKEAELAKFKKQHEEDLLKLKNDFNEYVIKRDEEYAAYLKQRWEEFQLLKGIKPPDEPKPDVIPDYKLIVKKPVPKKIIPKESIPILPEVKIMPKLPPIKKTDPESFITDKAIIDFYGGKITISFDPDLKINVTGEISQKSISKYWEAAVKTKYNHLIDQLKEQKKILNLNDWGYYLLIKEISSKINYEKANESVLLCWYLLTKSQYKAKVGYADNMIYVLLPSINTFYNVPFFKFNGIPYYVMDTQITNLFTYEKDFPDASIIMDLNIYHPLNMKMAKVQRPLSFDYENSKHSLNIVYNKNNISFYNDYPQADFEVFFSAAVSEETKASIIENLQPLLKNKSELESANLLLSFVQTAFAYKKDHDQFNKEKYFFAEEIFHYPFSDCEDRSVLFAYLVHELLNLEVVGVNYPGHMATAVCFNEAVDGDYLLHDGKNFIICDPTYINAPIGLSMPDYADKPAIIIEINKKDLIEKSYSKIRDLVESSGGFRGSTSGDIISDSHGNYYITGYFDNTLELGNSSFNAENNSRDIFLAKFDNNMEVIWVKKAGGSKDEIANGIALDKNDNIYIAGYFEGSISFDDRLLSSSDKGDIFMAKYDANGNLKWCAKAGLDTMRYSDELIFSVKFSTEGNNLGVSLYDASETFDNYGLSIDNEGNILFLGSFFHNVGFNKSIVKMDAGASFNVVTEIKNENDRLVEINYDRAIAGLFAVIYLVKNERMVIPGNKAQTTINKYNPNFREISPEIYKNIGKISFVKNSKGIITITTNDKEAVQFEQVKVKHNARINIITYKSGNAKIEILSGVKVGKAIIWYDLNSVTLYKNTGNLLFDYGNKHSTSEVNMKNDILD